MASDGKAVGGNKKLEWFSLPMSAASVGGQRPSQVVRESPPVLTPEKQHKVVTMERTSTGGTRREAQFKRAAIGPVSGAEREAKRRRRASLFPQQQVALREKDVQRKRQVAAAKVEAAATAAQQQAWCEDQQAYWALRLEEEYWCNLSSRFWILPCCGFRMELNSESRYWGPMRPACFHVVPCPGCGESMFRCSLWMNARKY